MLGKIADGLQQLKDEGVTVLFRPLHEINGDGFGGGLDSIIKKQRENLFVQTAYQKIYHYMTNEEDWTICYGCMRLTQTEILRQIFIPVFHMLTLLGWTRILPTRIRSRGMTS